MFSPDFIKLEKLDYTDVVLNVIKNWNPDPQQISVEEYNKYKEIILSKINNKKIPYAIQIERITLDTGSQGEKEEEFILSLEFDDIYLNFIEDIFASTECTNLQYNTNSERKKLSEIKSLCEIWNKDHLS